MSRLKLTKKEFMERYKLTERNFQQANITWKELLKIHDDFKSKHNEYTKVAINISNEIAKIPNVHSTRFRVKNAEHLIEKIIRKNIEKGTSINFQNYPGEITDLVGVRALHIYKRDWKNIDASIKSHWELLEPPTVYFREGDNTESLEIYNENGCVTLMHPHGYRSLHYLVRLRHTGFPSACEIQVRTIFEEGWSEIDHHLRYPYILDDEILSGYLGLLNKICGSADEMATLIDTYTRQIKRLKTQHREYTNIISLLESLVNEISTDPSDKGRLISELNKLKTVSRSIRDITGYDPRCRICGGPLPSSAHRDTCDACFHGQ